MAFAVAAGVMTSAKISSVPTAGTAMVMTPAMIAMNATFISPIGTPLACATCSSTELNSSGRYTIASTASRITSNTAKPRI